MPRSRVHARTSCCCEGYRRSSRVAGVRNDDVYFYYSPTSPHRALREHVRSQCDVRVFARALIHA